MNPHRATQTQAAVTWRDGGQIRLLEDSDRLRRGIAGIEAPHRVGIQEKPVVRAIHHPQAPGQRILFQVCWSSASSIAQDKVRELISPQLYLQPTRKAAVLPSRERSHA